jgi:uncharacterized protein
MRAHAQAAERRGLGRNVVDLRGVLVDRLEERLDRLEDTHREVLAAAYENVAGTNADAPRLPAVLEPGDFAGFLRVLTRDVPMILGRRRHPARAGGAGGRAPGTPLGPKGLLRRRGDRAARRRGRDLCHRRAGPRRAQGDAARRSARRRRTVYGTDAGRIRSEAVVKLDLGPAVACRACCPSGRPRPHGSIPTRAPIC